MDDRGVDRVLGLYYIGVVIRSFVTIMRWDIKPYCKKLMEYMRHFMRALREGEWEE